MSVESHGGSLARRLRELITRIARCPCGSGCLASPTGTPRAKESHMSEGESAATAGRTQPQIAVRPPDDPTYHVDPGHGWILFAGIMLAMIGVLNVVYGIAAVSNSKVFVRDVAFVLGSLNAWGWVLIVIGVCQLAVSVGIFRLSEAARWLGILFAAANGVVQLLVLPAHPVWALMVFFVDIIIVFGLLTYGGRDRYNLA